MLIPQAKPSFVYKYCAAPRATQIIKDLSFYFTPAAALNDLYEFKAKSLLTEDKNTKFKIYAKRLVAEGMFDSYEEALEIAQDLESDGVSSTYDDVMPQISATLKNSMAHSGVTCFTSSRNNQRMWGTYGDNHAGAVLEFTMDSGVTRFSKSLMPVLYIDSKPPLCPSELLTDKMTLDSWLLGALFCMKHVHWRDEYEWRLLLLADSPQTTKDRIVPFERASLTRVFLGPRIDAANESELRSAASRHKPPIPVFKRKVSDEYAEEENVGIEQIHSFSQLKYWAARSFTPTKDA